ncbi:MAG: FHA domain-containing protein, partial [Pirellulaceae bacterium]
MRVTLHVTAGPDAGRRIDLRNGLTARIGQSEWSDFSFASDQQMAEVHFAIRCEDQHCLLQVPQQSHPTSLNAESVTESRLHTGDRILAGLTEFLLDIEGDAGRSEAESADATDAGRAMPLGVAPLAGYLELDEALHPLAEESATDDEFLSRLIEAEQFQPASRLQAHLLNKPAAVWWGCLCLDQMMRDGLVGQQRAAREAAGLWAKEPTEDNRRAAESAAERAGYAGPGGSLAAAAFWSAGSLAPPESPEPVPPDERLTGQAVANAILFACLAKQPERMQEKLKECLEIARDLVDGKIE